MNEALKEKLNKLKIDVNKIVNDGIFKKEEEILNKILFLEKERSKIKWSDKISNEEWEKSREISSEINQHKNTLDYYSKQKNTINEYIELVLKEKDLEHFKYILKEGISKKFPARLCCNYTLEMIEEFALSGKNSGYSLWNYFDSSIKRRLKEDFSFLDWIQEKKDNKELMSLIIPILCNLWGKIKFDFEKHKEIEKIVLLNHKDPKIIFENIKDAEVDFYSFDDFFNKKQYSDILEKMNKNDFKKFGEYCMEKCVSSANLSGMEFWNSLYIKLPEGDTAPACYSGFIAHLKNDENMEIKKEKMDFLISRLGFGFCDDILIRASIASGKENLFKYVLMFYDKEGLNRINKYVIKKQKKSEITVEYVKFIDAYTLRVKLENELGENKVEIKKNKI